MTEGPQTTSANASVLDVGQLIDEGRVTPYQVWLVSLTAIAIIFDGADNQLLGIAIPSIIQDWQVRRDQFAPVVALGLFGMMVGSAVAGRAGDRVGRRVALIASVGVFGAATLGVWGARSIEGLAVLRFIAGIGLGGALPNAAALAAEFVPLRHRPLAVTLTIVCVPLGGTLAGLFALRMMPVVGWQGLFAIGGATPLLVALGLAMLLPESPRYLASRPARWAELGQLLRRMQKPVAPSSRFAESGRAAPVRVPVSTLLNSSFRRDTLALWAAFFSCLMAVYLGFSWLPAILVGAGLSGDVASTSITVFNLGGVFGSICGGLLIGRFGSKRLMVTSAIGAVVGAVVLSLIPLNATAPVMPIIVMIGITGGLINTVQPTMFALAAHVYPTELRATGVGVATAVGRTGAILAGFAGPWALAIAGSTSFFVLMAAALLVTSIALAVVRRHVPSTPNP